MRLQLGGLVLKFSGVDAQLLHVAGAAQAYQAFAYRSRHTAPGDCRHIAGRRHADPGRPHLIQHGFGQRVLAALLQRRGKGQQVMGLTLGGDGSNQLGLTFGQGAGLVKSHDVDGVGNLQRLGVLDQNAVACSYTRAGHDGGGCCQAQRTGAGDDQHRHRVQNGLFPIAVVDAPAQQCEQRQQQHNRHKHGTHLVHHALDGRLFCLSRFDHAHDARQRGLRPYRVGLHQQQALCIDRTTCHAVAHEFADRQALTGNQGFVNLACTFDDDAVDRNARAGPNDHHIANGYPRDRQFDICPILANNREFRAQGIERLNGCRGLLFGPGLQPLAQQHQRDDDRRRFKIQVRRAVVGVFEHQVQTQAEPRGCAERHQQVHIAGTSAQGFPARPVKACTQPELHRCGKQQLQPSAEHPVLAERHAQHGHYQGQ